MLSDVGMDKLWLAASKAFLISLVATPIVRDIFRAYNVVDRPGRRKVHAYPIPRVGGIPIAAGYAIALLSLVTEGSAMPGDWVWKLLPGATVIFMTGLIDDFFNLRPVVKLLGEIAVAGTAYVFGLRIQGFGGHSAPDWLSLPLTVFWLLLAMNAQNLIDGLDGLCAGIGFFATVTFVCAGLIQDNSALVSLALPLSGALVGFLFYNYNPATVFLGDSGALTIGFLLGCFGLVWTEQGTGLLGSLVPVLAMIIPLMDLSLSIARRSLRGQPIFSADRGHIHHRLLDRGFSVRRSALTLYAIAIVAAAFAVLVSYPAVRAFHGVVVFGFAIAIWIGIRQLRYPEFRVAGLLLFHGVWRGAFDKQLCLERLRTSLHNAETEEEWWNAVVAAAREQGWRTLRWKEHHPPMTAILPGPDLAGGEADASESGWSFEIPLGDNQSIQIEGSPKRQAETGAPPDLDLIAFSFVLRETLAARRTQPAFR
jgi:UDP-GlcNAc:undecaprenyl-phosphate/decaprenyl-phosphate GlcNAc-1-phosphate transferase